jgi:ribosomal protein L37E
MEDGFLLEMGDGNAFSSQTWVAGKLEKSFFFGLSLKGKVVYDVKTFRCIACGYLDSYALQKR